VGCSELALNIPRNQLAPEGLKRRDNIGHSTCCHLHTEVLIQVDLGVEQRELSGKGRLETNFFVVMATNRNVPRHGEIGN
jgi:hypothetical protein